MCIYIYIHFFITGEMADCIIQQGNRVGAVQVRVCMYTVTCKINGNRSDGVPVVNWYK